MNEYFFKIFGTNITNKYKSDKVVVVEIDSLLTVKLEMQNRLPQKALNFFDRPSHIEIFLNRKKCWSKVRFKKSDI